MNARAREIVIAAACIVTGFLLGIVARPFFDWLGIP
jgi:hypothetical protein